MAQPISASLESTNNSSNKLLRYFFIAGAVEGLLVLVYLLTIPSDPKNALLFGFSLTRLLLASVLIIVIALHTYLAYGETRKEPPFKRLRAWIAGFIQDYGLVLPAFLFAYMALLVVTYVYLFLATPNLTTLQGYFLRFSPFVVLATTRVIQATAVLVLASRGASHLIDKVDKKPGTVTLAPQRIAVVLGLVAIFLILASIAVETISLITWDTRVFGLGPRFDLDREHNIPTFFSAILLLVTGLLSGAVALTKNNRKDATMPYWAILSFIFIFMSFDEATSIHEMFMDPLRGLLDAGGIFYFTWVVIAIPLVLLFGIGYWRFFQQVPRKFRNWLFLSLGLYLMGALGFELLGGWYADQYSQNDLLYNVITTVEESLELLGAVLLIRTLLVYIKDTWGGLHFQLGASEEATK
ncbi:MAG: hypothetical protein DWQ07_24060 [Chloroflexi bacterium]|nr:MAG: hypothetical protein DWQ07_24060 [Chloroflexota bacterium]MBL1194223.1 hypothetical protein [Chloroflexota bacterium]NOH11516.1 hypothetical protein [Chloroflexota bacterium]